MIPAAELFEKTNTGLVIIERDGGTVLEHYGCLPAVPQDGIDGRDWRDALGIPPDSTGVIAQAISAGVSAALPPTIIAAGADGEVVMGGMVVPERYADREVVLLFLRRLASDEELYVDGGIEELDIVAVLGVDHLEFSPTWGVLETDRLMVDLRNGLRQILRDGDWIGLAAGASITVILKNLEPEGALDICRALLSHLHQRLASKEGGAQHARACIGLSQRLAGQDALAPVLAANGALLQAQAGTHEHIRFSSPWDPLGQAARAVNATGAFHDTRRGPDFRHYLKRIDAIVREQPVPELLLEQILLVTAEQPGLSGAALLRCDCDGQLLPVCVTQCKDGKSCVVPGGKLPRPLKTALRTLPVDVPEGIARLEPTSMVSLLPITGGRGVWGYLALIDEDRTRRGFRPGAAALQTLAGLLAEGQFSRGGEPSTISRHAREMEKGIEGYVVDNMEGAIDQAIFLAGIDIPIAIVGPRGTGKMYLAQVIHAHGGGDASDLVQIDCNGFRNRNEALARITRELSEREGKTVVFKSPHLLHVDTQARLARLLASRTLSDSRGSRYLPQGRYVALFPESVKSLLRKGELDERLASVFAGYPIDVPPLRDRGRAVLRWAHKMLEQEAAQLDRRVAGFTPDAEQAMLRHDWPGNISEMREVIRASLGRTDKEWITPVDLGIFRGISADGLAATSTDRPFLELMQEEQEEDGRYTPSTHEEMRMALGQALAASQETGTLRPLGAWLDDEIILAVCERYGNDGRAAADFLHTRSRNIGRWMPKILEREPERNASLMWQDARKLVRRWVLELTPQGVSPQQQGQEVLLALVLQQCSDASVTERARIMGVSTPTYQKRLKQLLQEA